MWTKTAKRDGWKDVSILANCFLLCLCLWNVLVPQTEHAVSIFKTSETWIASQLNQQETRVSHLWLANLQRDALVRRMTTALVDGCDICNPRDVLLIVQFTHNENNLCHTVDQLLHWYNQYQ